MALFESIPGLIILIAIVALNVLSRVFRGKVPLILISLSIALHIAIAPVMLFSGCPFSELALVYIFSFFVFTLAVYIAKKKGESK